MRQTLVTLSLSLFITFTNAQTSSSEQTAVLASIHQFVDGFNKGDTKMALAACADQTSIIDEFPPHEWHGPGACGQWASDFDADAKKNGITGGLVTLGKPSHVDISADRAYVVMPANYTFKQKGKSTGEVGSVITLTLQKATAGWRITGWAWAKH
jgi:hypothetical protein